jgi:NAD(P)-dependent dehydrogenase (short-subunit alcohol dehydrogenase family)
VAAILRHGLLDGQTVLASVPDHGPGAAAAAECERLGASVVRGSATETLDTVLVEGRLAPGEDPDAALVAALGEVWEVVRAAANAALIPRRRGKLVLVGPRPDDRAQTQGLRDGLENMARTLSIEWARYGVLPTMIAPGAGTTDADVATLVAYLVSPAGDYYSGCRFQLGSV